jgi:FkbM family methyltransferase
MFKKVVRGFRAILGLINPKTWGFFIEHYENTKFRAAINFSWSQAGEDIGLAMALNSIENGTYVDVGAHHPTRFSVTQKLYVKGWTGINIDANPELMKRFDSERPKDINICALIGDSKEYTFSIFQEPAISTTNAEWRDRFLSANNEIISEFKIRGLPLSEVFSQYLNGSFPDLLCIDAEGSDLEVLLSAKLSPGKGPEWILLESFPPLKAALSTPAVKHAIELGYEVYLQMPMSTLLRLPQSKR